jgi:hypothetical protein
MSRWLIITNGDDAAANMREARIAGDVLPWRDILHEGPVPAALTLDELSALRAEFLAGQGWGTKEELLPSFRARDQRIREHSAFDTIVLWFEHDLYDQLQLLQLLDFFAAEKRDAGLYLIQAGKHLGQETPKGLRTQLALMEPVSAAHLALGRLAWSGFRSPTPEPWAALLRLSTHVLPFLRLSILRLLEELPSPRSGLSRTEETILNLVASGVRRPRELYEVYTQSEEAHFMGDWSFYRALDRLGGGRAPLIAGFGGLSYFPASWGPNQAAYIECELSLTHFGYSVVKGTADALRDRAFERDLGGYRFNSRAAWRWDRAKRQLLAPPDEN